MANPNFPKRRGAEQKVIGPNGMKLKQLQFRSYIHDIAIYHFQAYYISVSNFRSLLNRQEHGYVDTLLSFDPLHDKPVPDGDELPEGCVEVGYLPSVFQHGGSALGFRVGNDVVEWMCFDRAIDELILNKVDVRDLGPTGKLMLFDHVADVLRGVPERRVRGANPEHRAWHHSLWRAEHRPVKSRLTWRNFGTELQRQHALQRMEYAELEHKMSDLDVDDQGFADHEVVEMSGDDTDEEEFEDYGGRIFLGGEQVDDEEEGEDEDGDGDGDEEVEDEDEDEDENEDQDIAETAIGQFVYENEDAEEAEEMDNTPSKNQRPTHSRSFSNSTMLGEMHTDTLRTRLPPTFQQGHDKRLLNDDCT